MTLGNQRGVVAIGNVDVTIFERATQAEIEAEVRRCIDTVRPALALRPVDVLRAPAAVEPGVRPVVHGRGSRLRPLRSHPRFLVLDIASGLGREHGWGETTTRRAALLRSSGLHPGASARPGLGNGSLAPPVLPERPG